MINTNKKATFGKVFIIIIMITSSTSNSSSSSSIIIIILIVIRRLSEPVVWAFTIPPHHRHHHHQHHHRHHSHQDHQDHQDHHHHHHNDNLWCGFSSSRFTNQHNFTSFVVRTFQWKYLNTDTWIYLNTDHSSDTVLSMEIVEYLFSTYFKFANILHGVSKGLGCHC